MQGEAPIKVCFSECKFLRFYSFPRRAALKRSVNWIFVFRLEKFLLVNCFLSLILFSILVGSTMFLGFEIFYNLVYTLSICHCVRLYYTKRKFRIFGDILLNFNIFSSKLVILFFAMYICHQNIFPISTLIFSKPDSIIDNLWFSELL